MLKGIKDMQNILVVMEKNSFLPMSMIEQLKELGYKLPPHIYTVKYGANAILDLLGGNKNV